MGSAAEEDGVTDIHRYRIIEWPHEDAPGWTLVTLAGAAELGVPVEPDDELLLLCPPGSDRRRKEQFAATLRAEGHVVVLEEDGDL